MELKRSEIVEQLESIFQDTFTSSNFNFSEDLNREDVEEWDSLNHIRLLTALEAHFGFQFDLDEIGNLTSVSAIVDVIDSKNI